MKCPYRGSSKHKNRPTRGQKGTLCPEWTHVTLAGGLENDVYDHDWSKTLAAQLFANAVIDAKSSRRYATARGIAFEAKPTEDGTWHGYPIPWESVPASIKRDWLAKGAVGRANIRRFLSFDRNEIHWALKTDSR